MTRSIVLAVTAATMALMGAGAPTIARAQSSVPGFGSIIGSIQDSLHDGGLARAGVVVAQLPQHHTVTTASGAFRIDSLPPGRYTLEVTHPVLDSLGIRVASDTISVAAGQDQVITIGIPGARTLTSLVCTPAKLHFGPGVILGRVADADTDKPAEGAEVSVAWTETEIGTDIGVRSAPRLRKTTVAADGTYRICGVPASFKGTLQATRGSSRTAEVPIDVSGQAVSVRLLFLPSVSAQAPSVGNANGAHSIDPTNPADPSNPTSTTSTARTLATGTAVIRGKVTNAGGVPVGDARVTVPGTTASTATNADGSFTLTGVPAGTQAVLVRRLGYAPVERPIDVRSKAANQMIVRLGTYTPQLATVEVKEKQPDTFGNTGFGSRRRLGMGKYLDQAQIDAIAPTYTSDALRRVPGLVVSGSGGLASITTSRGNGCVNFMIDRNPVMQNSQTIDEALNVHDIAAVEFYQPIDIPMELSSGANTGCALVAIWTKSGVSGPGKH